MINQKVILLAGMMILLFSYAIFIDAMIFGYFTGLIGMAFFLVGSGMITYSMSHYQNNN